MSILIATLCARATNDIPRKYDPSTTSRHFGAETKKQLYSSYSSTSVTNNRHVQLIAAAFERSVGSVRFVNGPHLWHGQTMRFLRNVQTQLQSTVVRPSVTRDKAINSMTVGAYDC